MGNHLARFKAHRNPRSSKLQSGHHEIETTIYPEGMELCSIPQKDCKKNPGHKNFIHVDKFTKEHFPEGYREDWRVEMVKAVSDLTVHLLSLGASEERRKFYGKSSRTRPLCSSPRVGTGFVEWVEKCGEGGEKHEDKICECRDCKNSLTPRKTWWEVDVMTAAHVVCNKLEVSDTKVGFFKGESEKYFTWGEGDMVVLAFMKEDWCVFRVIVHDEEVGERLERAFSCYRELDDCGRKGDPMFIVSHPHGLEKCVTVGQLVSKEYYPVKGKRWSSYTYTCDTCPGSSGAAVVRGDRRRKRAPHSGAAGDGTNRSAYGRRL